jgi:CheY-like chemotaxis protein
MGFDAPPGIDNSHGVSRRAILHTSSTYFSQAAMAMKTVLLIDDDNIFLLTIGVRLKSMGYTVYAAKDAVNAISAVRKNNPDVIVLDVSLPAGDGFMVAERLQKLISTAATPIIFVTASENPGLRERATKVGAVAFLKKPLDATTLADAIESALSPGDSWRPQANAV